jgi:hypothetical protein
LGAIKVIPALETSIENPRLMDTSSEKTTLKILYHVFLDRNQDVYRTLGQKWGWWEYGAYTGKMPLILLLFGIFIFWKTESALILAGFLTFLTSLGNFAKWAPWNLLHKLPLIESTRIPSRYMIIAVFSIAIIAGLAFESLYKESKRSPKTKYFLMIIAVLIISDLMLVNSKNFARTFNNSPEILDGGDFHQIRDYNVKRSGSDTSLYLNLLSNRGTVNGYGAGTDAKLPVKALGDADYKGEVYLQGNGTVSYKYWSPNKYVVNVDAPQETRLIINQRYDSGWRVKDGIAENFGGLLSAKISPENKIVEFYYLPTSFVIGLIVTSLSIIFLVFFILKKHNSLRS